MKRREENVGSCEQESKRRRQMEDVRDRERERERLSNQFWELSTKVITSPQALLYITFKF
jgi:hypothetical protein